MEKEQKRQAPSNGEKAVPSDTSKFTHPAPKPEEKNFYPKHNPENVR